MFRDYKQIKITIKKRFIADSEENTRRKSLAYSLEYWDACLCQSKFIHIFPEKKMLLFILQVNAVKRYISLVTFLTLKSNLC